MTEATIEEHIEALNKAIGKDAIYDYEKQSFSEHSYGLYYKRPSKAILVQVRDGQLINVGKTTYKAPKQLRSSVRKILRKIGYSNLAMQLYRG